MMQIDFAKDIFFCHAREFYNVEARNPMYRLNVGGAHNFCQVSSITRKHG